MHVEAENLTRGLPFVKSKSRSKVLLEKGTNWVRLRDCFSVNLLLNAVKEGEGRYSEMLKAIIKGSLMFGGCFERLKIHNQSRSRQLRNCNIYTEVQRGFRQWEAEQGTVNLLVLENTDYATPFCSFSLSLRVPSSDGETILVTVAFVRWIPIWFASRFVCCIRVSQPMDRHEKNILE